MTQPASDVYKVLVQSTSRPKGLLRMVGVFIINLVSLGAGPQNPGGRIIRILDRTTGEQIFEHIEAMGEDEASVLEAIERDLVELTADEFHATWHV